MYSNTKKWLLENLETVVLFVALIVAFFVYSSFYLSLPPKFNSPDETSNYFFIKNYVENGVIRVFEPLNFAFDDRIHPRSVLVVNGYLVPGGFLGLILIYGWLAKIFSMQIIPFLTPLFASLAVFCFYKIIKKIFDSKIAFWSSFLILIHPAFWYYSARGLFPNVLFLSFLIIGFYFLVCRRIILQITVEGDVDARPKNFFSEKGREDFKERRERETYIHFILAGLFFGLAMTVRLSEIIWVGGVLFFLFLIYRKSLSWKQIILFLIFAILTFSPIFAYNQVFYGNPFLTSYNLSDSRIIDSEQWVLSWLLSFSRYVFPFGLHLKNILNNFSNYFVGLFWWLAIPLVVGLLLYVKKIIDNKLNKEQKIYLGVYLFISSFLFVYYGSWLFYDNPAKEVSIGTSYVRYWLPIYILSAPFIIFVFEKLISLFRGNFKKILVFLLCAVYIFLSVNLTFFDRNDGLVAVKKNVKEYAKIASEVRKIIEPDAVIIVDRADKIFFPEYRVIYSLRDEETYDLIPRIVNLIPLYYYGITLPQKDIDYLYAKKLDPQKVEIVKIKDFGIETLYRLKSRIKNQELR